ncbi:hypothetical protein BDA99DRAFT_516547 [Phascolomyces articulosus]|uniref:Ubiquitinyl hydrolase 1 n=1 Tax=Phascolomyces articulosus TaxID=60185 RepID=A0AAD5K5B1_9FUNG|nr:hypothetical protein BDA99DRAFT_516547 [Phascolomyces articulosus]
MTIDEQLPPYRPVDTPAEPPRVLSVVHDYDKIADELFEKVDEELIESKCVHWDIANFKSLSDRVRGPEFEVGGHKWNLLLFPKGNSQNSFASLYLQWNKPAESSKEDEAYACAQFAICLSSPRYPTNYVSYAARHRFTPDEDDWGFTRLVNLERIYEGNEETNRDPLLQQGQIRATAIIRVFKDSTGVLWHHFIGYDSKKHLNIVGIKNAGSTGYLTALLQWLFFTNYFRKSIYQAPALETSILAALQELFYQLQFSSKTVETTELTKAFGWDALELFIEHDLFEVKEVLQASLERSNPSLPGLYRRLFGIRYANGKCDYDFQLDMDGIPTLDQALSNHVFERGNEIDQLPPILHIALKRMRYNKTQKRMEKIKDRFTYPLEIDLDPFLGQYSDRSESHVYVLQSVIAHGERSLSSGYLSSGYYHTYIRPTCKGNQWIKFSDEQVHPVKESDVLEGNYGGPPLDKPDSPARIESAYILSYIRKSRLEEVLPEIPVADIPKTIATRIAQKQRGTTTTRRVWAVTEESFKEFNNQFDMLNLEHTSSKSLTYDKTKTTMGDLEKMVKEALFPGKETKCRLWVIIKRMNGTFRPDEALNFTINKNQLAEQVLAKGRVDPKSTFGIYAETPVGPPIRADQILIFIKYFDIEAQTLR